VSGDTEDASKRSIVIGGK